MEGPFCPMRASLEYGHDLDELVVLERECAGHTGARVRDVGKPGAQQMYSYCSASFVVLCAGQIVFAANP
jgi:hypothetical protein